MTPFLRGFYGRYRETAPLRALRTARNRWRGLLEARRERIFFETRCGTVLKTPPARLSASAKTEIHTLVCHRHVLMYLTAVKSLLRFSADFAVCVHDDGSLTAADRALIESHVEGVRVIPKAEADAAMEVCLKGRPRCLELRRSQIVSIQLFDFALLSRTGRVAAIDSDTLFLGRPDQLLEWAASDDREVLHLYEKKPREQASFLAAAGCAYPPHFCMGFACFPKAVVDVDRIEKTLSRVEKYDWWISQNVFPTLIEGRFPARHFDPASYQDLYRLNARPVFRHYWGSILRDDSFLQRVYSDDTHRVFGEMGLARKSFKDEAKLARELDQNIEEGTMGGYSRTSERFPHGDPWSWTPQLWNWARESLGVRSVLDVGAGEAHCARYFRDLGCDVLAVDGSRLAQKNSLVPESHRLHDFSREAFIPPKTYDMVWSCEFVEHVEEGYSGNFLKTFATAGKYIFMTYAEPGQPGWHHVNCQPASYWIDRVSALGFRLDEDLTRLARQIADEGHFASKGLVFVRKPETV